MKSLFYPLLFQVLIVCSCFAQGVLQDVIYLKNGSVIHGTIMEEIIGKTIKIKTSTGDIFVYPFDEVEKIDKEPTPAAVTSISTPESPQLQTQPQIAPHTVNGAFPTPQYTHTGFLGIGTLGLNNGPETVFSWKTIYGIQTSDFFFIGVGGGTDYYSNGSFVPLFLDLRLFFAKSPASLFLFLDGGYSFGTLTGVSGDFGGGMLNVGIGYRFFVSRTGGFVADCGYKLQAAEDYNSNYNYDPLTNQYYTTSGRTPVSYDCFSVTLGYYIFF